MHGGFLLVSTAACWGVRTGCIFFAFYWRHNDHGGVSNHQPHDCLLNGLFRRRSKKTSKLRVTGLCAGNSPGPVNSPHKRPVTRKMFPFDDVIMVAVKVSDEYLTITFTVHEPNCWSHLLFITCGRSTWSVIWPALTEHLNDKCHINALRPRKVAVIFQTTFSNAFSSMKMYEFWLKFHWSLFLEVQLTIFLHWFR